MVGSPSVIAKAARRRLIAKVGSSAACNSDEFRHCVIDQERDGRQDALQEARRAKLPRRREGSACGGRLSPPAIDQPRFLDKRWFCQCRIEDRIRESEMRDG